MASRLYEVMSLSDSDEVFTRMIFEDSECNPDPYSIPLRVGQAVMSLGLNDYIFPLGTDKDLINAVMYHGDNHDFMAKTVSKLI